MKRLMMIMGLVTALFAFTEAKADVKVTNNTANGYWVCVEFDGPGGNQIECKFVPPGGMKNFMCNGRTPKKVGFIDEVGTFMGKVENPECGPMQNTLFPNGDKAKWLGWAGGAFQISIF